MILQLNPTIPVETPKGHAHCLGWLDYSQEHSLMWVCAQDEGGEIWIWPQELVRAKDNITLGRKI